MNEKEEWYWIEMLEFVEATLTAFGRIPGYFLIQAIYDGHFRRLEELAEQAVNKLGREHPALSITRVQTSVSGSVAYRRPPQFHGQDVTAPLRWQRDYGRSWGTSRGPAAYFADIRPSMFEISNMPNPR